jgi:hypothetical protein
MSKHQTASLLEVSPQRPTGRPTVYRPELCDLIVAAMGEGLSLEAAAASCGIGPRTAFTWQAQHDEFRQAVEEGRTKSLLFWERRAIALSKGEAGNAAVITLGLKNRSRAASGWHDAQRLEHSGPNGASIQQDIRADINLKVLTDDELALFEELLIKTLPHNDSQM